MGIVLMLALEKSFFVVAVEVLIGLNEAFFVCSNRLQLNDDFASF